MLSGESTSFPLTCVFFRMVSLESRQAMLKRVMSYWRPSAEWAVTAASSAKRSHADILAGPWNLSGEVEEL